MNGNDDGLASKRLLVCIDEIQQNFVFGEEFSGRYVKTVTLADGTTRTIELTAMMRDGMPVVELKDTGHCSYMGLNGTTTNGKLMVQIRDVEAMLASVSQEPAPSRVFPPGTSLITVPDLAPPGFAHGIEVLNDDATPMQFVVAVLGAELGLGHEDSVRTMLEIHTRGGALLPTDSMAEAQRIAAAVTAEAAKHGHPLICRPVSNG